MADLIEYWINSSDDDALAMQHLFERGDYTWALFLGHIVLEKLLKACIVKKTGGHPPLIHDLSRLADKAGLQLVQQQLDLLDTITTFNIRARYDDYKQEFKSKCTREYAYTMITSIEEVRAWIKNKL